MYAKFCLGKRWLKAEAVIVQDAEWAYEYALSVMKGRWKEAEPVIALSREWAEEYAKNVVKGTFPETKTTEVKMESEYSVLEAVKASLDSLRLQGTDKYKPAEIGEGFVSRQFRNFDYPEFYSEEKAVEVLKGHFQGMTADCFKITKGAGNWLTIEVTPKIVAAKPAAKAKAVAAPAPMPQAVAAVPKTSKTGPFAVGRTATEVTDPMEISKIVAAYKPGVNGYQALEKQFNLREANGMTAYRIVKKYQKESKSETVEAANSPSAKRCQGPPEPPGWHGWHERLPRPTW
jgi:hypothetical protein